MESSQKFYYKFIGDKIVMYMIDTCEGYVVRIPDIFEGFYKHIKSCQLDVFVTLEDIILRYNLKWLEFDEL